MLFRKVEKSCSYCTRAIKIDEETMACRRKGPVSVDGACRAFRYDPLKRIPEAPEMELPVPEDDADYSL